MVPRRKVVNKGTPSSNQPNYKKIYILKLVKNALKLVYMIIKIIQTKFCKTSLNFCSALTNQDKNFSIEITWRIIRKNFPCNYNTKGCNSQLNKKGSIPKKEETL